LIPNAEAGTSNGWKICLLYEGARIAMANRIGVRLEDKNKWERRVPLAPADVSDLVAENVAVCIERSARRVFEDAKYAEVNASVKEDVGDCDVILGVKEMPKGYFKPGKAYMFFSHTIKGQPYNMKMLAELVEKKCTLLDYELVTNDKGFRLIFFGRFAGIAGMIDTLWTMGRRLRVLGVESPFADIEPAHRYSSLEQA
jgi:saccharopine dehydrogenase (NAD+, L-lysine-forming)